MVAAERISRCARLVEFDPVYVDRIIARWERMTEGKAELLARTEAMASPEIEEEAA